MSGDRWYTVAEAAAMLGCSRHTLYRGCDRGTIPHRRARRRVLIDRAWADGVDIARAVADSGTFNVGRSTCEIERFVGDFAKAVAVELALLLGEAAAHATTPVEPGVVLDLTPATTKVDSDGTRAG